MASMVYLRYRPRSVLRAFSPACSFSSRSHLFSSSSSPPDFNDGNPPNAESNQTDARSSFNVLKSHLRDRETYQQPPRKPFSFSQGATSTSTSLDEIRNNLKDYRSSVQNPQPASQTQPLLFQQIYKQSFSEPGPANRSSSPLGSLESIKESFRRMNVQDKRKAPSFKLSNLSDSLRGRPNAEETNWPGSSMIGGTTEGLPLQAFGKEMLQSKEGESAEDVNSNGLVRGYSCDELGEQLRKLRPEGVKKEEKWFSISELNQRLIKLREIEKNKIKTGGQFSQIRHTLLTVQNNDNKRDRMESAHRFDTISQLSGGTPNYMSTSPKEHLVEKYFHPDNMSAADKLKIELKRVRDEFKMSDTDCGSTRVQIAQLTTEISYLSKTLHKKDKHSRKGLIAKVQMRKKLLKYLRRTDWDSYCFILSSLGLRDNPGYKQVKQ